MSEMVKRVAEEMYNAFQEALAPNFGPDWKPKPFAENDERMRSFYLISARRGIAAMREPTEAMVRIGVDFALRASVSGIGGWPRYVTEKHRAMIDEALR